jgi:hypothetical protein
VLTWLRNMNFMSDEISHHNEWPEELDAMVAAPQHHKLLLENNFVRVIDTLILPGETTNVHTHKWPASLYIISWSDFIRYDEKANIVLDSRKLPKTPLSASTIWSDPLGPHALENIGSDPIHIISVEIKR